MSLQSTFLAHIEHVVGHLPLSCSWVVSAHVLAVGLRNRGVASVGLLSKTAFVLCRMSKHGGPRIGVCPGQRQPPSRGLDTLVPLHWCCCTSAVHVNLVWQSFTSGVSMFSITRWCAGAQKRRVVSGLRHLNPCAPTLLRSNTSPASSLRSFSFPRAESKKCHTLHKITDLNARIAVYYVTNG